jgi:hypothetical protein
MPDAPAREPAGLVPGIRDVIERIGVKFVQTVDAPDTLKICRRAVA